MCGQVITLLYEAINNYENLHTCNQYFVIGKWNHYGKMEKKLIKGLWNHYGKMGKKINKGTCGPHRDPSLHPGKINHN